jgi:hypothetical protein
LNVSIPDGIFFDVQNGPPSGERSSGASHHPGKPEAPDRVGKPRRALDAFADAQRIAFGPIAFQATVAMQRLGILDLLARHRRGVGLDAIAESLELSRDGLTPLIELAAHLGIVEVDAAGAITLTALGIVVHGDRMTQVNIDFVNEVCYQGMQSLAESVKSGRPEGLRVFGEWRTVYEGLAHLPGRTREAWFAFDHFYSDAAFPAALNVVFADRPTRLLDIGGNTGRWALACCEHDPDVAVCIVDLPGQLATAREHTSASPAAARITFHEADILDDDQEIPPGADAIWMSQFLDCFGPDEIVRILRKVARASTATTDIYVLEPFIDDQKFPAAAFSLAATSLYFTAIANGNSRLYTRTAMVALIEDAGLRTEATHALIANSHHTVLRCRAR